MTYFPTDQPEKVEAEFRHLLAKEKPISEAEIVEKAGLGDEEVLVLRSHADRILPVIQSNPGVWLFAIPPHESRLKRTLRQLRLLDSDKVIGNGSAFVRNLFSRSHDPSFKPVPGGVHIGVKSEENRHYEFELDVLAFLFNEVTKIELEPRLASGKRSEFRVDAVGGRYHVEAKCIATETLHANIWETPHGPSEAAERKLRGALKNQVKAAREKFCNEDGPYAIFVDTCYPIELFGGKTLGYIERKKSDGLEDRNLKYLALRRGIEEYEVIENE